MKRVKSRGIGSLADRTRNHRRDRAAGPASGGLRECTSEVCALLRRDRPALIAVAAVRFDICAVLDEQDQLAARIPRLHALMSALRAFGRKEARLAHILIVAVSGAHVRGAVPTALQVRCNRPPSAKKAAYHRGIVASPD